MNRQRPGTGLFRSLGAAAESASADFRAIFTWRSWLFGWLTRVVSQAVLYGLLGRMLGSPAQQRYLFVGAAVLVSGVEALLVCASTANERRAGMLALIVASPSDLFPVLVGRGLQWGPGGVVTSAVCLFLVGPAFGITWTGFQALTVVPLLVLTAFSTYCLGVALGALVLARPELRNVVGTVAASSLAMVCGVTVPLQAWPWPVQLIGTSVPLTHTLSAVRASMDGAPASAVLLPAASAVIWAAAWLGVSWVVVRRLVTSGRRNGWIELGGAP